MADKNPVETPEVVEEVKTEAKATKGKKIKVEATRQINLGKLDPKGSILHFQKEEVKEIPYNDYTQETIDHAIEHGFLKKVK